MCLSAAIYLVSLRLMQSGYIHLTIQISGLIYFVIYTLSHPPMLSTVKTLAIHCDKHGVSILTPHITHSLFNPLICAANAIT
jgi:hypothetical protein